MAANGLDTSKMDGNCETMPVAHFSQPEPPTPTKRKLDETDMQSTDARDDKRRKGSAPIKAEYLVPTDSALVAVAPPPLDDDAAEAFHHKDRAPAGKNSKRREKNQGQNTNRRFGRSRDEVGLCSTRVNTPEFAPEECRFGDRCKFEHNLRRYLSEHKREDLSTFGGLCPVWDVKGTCEVGWKCRFVGSHSKEVEHGDERKELVLVEDEEQKGRYSAMSSAAAENETGVVNSISTSDRILLTKKKVQTPKSDLYLEWLDNQTKEFEKATQKPELAATTPLRDPFRTTLTNSSSPGPSNGTDTLATTSSATTKEDSRALYTEPPLLPSEKRRLYFGPETPVLAPLTTQGNLPFRRLCTSLGATFTYSEMAMSLPLLQGHRPEWALLKAHESETQPPTFIGTSKPNVVYDYRYNPSTDIRFGAQIAANKPWVALKATEILTTLLPRGLRLIDLNVGCPIDLVYREGAGSALMDSPGKLEKMLRGMNAVSNEVPITIKIRMGTKDGKPTAQKLVERLVLGDGNTSSSAGASGVAAVTLHGRSRQQRYTREANWEYIAETAELVKSLNEKADRRADTVQEVDERDLPNPHKGSSMRRNAGKVFFLGNGDVYSHEHYTEHLTYAGVDTCMVARGALMKPWIFEEIAAGQYLDKSSAERLEYVEKFCRFGLEAWGSDEIGVGQTRRFLLEWLSFACRYVPVGLLERLPPNIQDRPPRYRGRDELETLMASDNFRDWIKIRYVNLFSGLLARCAWDEELMGVRGAVRCSLVQRTRTSDSSRSIRATAMRSWLKARKRVEDKLSSRMRIPMEIT
jgi:tRNA-dihydrouridine synthase 3